MITKYIMKLRFEKCLTQMLHQNIVVRCCSIVIIIIMHYITRCDPIDRLSSTHEIIETN